MNLQTRIPATRSQIMARITALEMHYPKSPMTDGERRMWFQTFCEDFQHKTDAELAYACQRYRQDAGNKFFPSPGQLLTLCQPAFEAKPRHYQDIEELPPARPQEQIDAMLQRARVSYPDAFKPKSAIFDADRAPVAMTEEMKELEASLREERQETLVRRLQHRHG